MSLEKSGRKKPMSMQHRLLILLVVMILPFITFSVFKAFDINKRLEGDAQIESLGLAKSVASSIDENITATGELLISIANNRDVRNQNYPEITAFLKSIDSKYPFYTNIAFVDVNGDVKAMGGCPPKGPAGPVKKVTAKGTAHYERAMRSNGLSTGDFMYGKFTGAPVIHVTYPVFSFSGKRLGYIAAVLDLTKVQQRLMDPSPPKHTVIAVLDSKGTVIARNIDPAKWVGKNLSMTMDFTKMLGKTEGTGKTRNPDGTTRVFAFAAAKKVPWFVRAGVDSNYIRNQVQTELIYHFAVFIPLLLIAMLGWLWIGRDVNRLHQKTEKLTLIDPLTGLWNSRKLSQDFKNGLDQAKRYDEQLSFAMIDIDHFKVFNDNNGHQEGDTALCTISSIICDSVRDVDLVYRYGGEELCVFMPETNKTDAIAAVERIRANVEKASFINEENQPSGKLTVSIGIATYPDDATSKEDIIRYADVALYRAKENGRNRVEIYSRDATTTMLHSFNHLVVLKNKANDVTECVQIEEALHDNESGCDKRSRMLFEKAGDAIFIIQAEGDQAGQIISANKSAADMHGYTMEELLSLNIKDLDTNESALQTPARIQQILAGEWITEETLHQKKDGTVFPVEINAGLLEFDSQKYILAFDKDISARREVEEMRNFMAYYDTLTGLPNKVLLTDRLNLAMMHAHREDEMLAVLCVGLDNFKAINETLGHDAGDIILQHAANQLASQLREGDTIARLSGDEFVLMLPQMNVCEDIAKVAQKLLETFQLPFEIDDCELYTTVSIGISLYPDDGEDAQTLLKHADAALSLAKRHGKNGYQFYTASMNEKAIKKFAMENSLRKALENEEFILYYQPQMDLNSNLIGMEALIRWQHPDLGLVQPMEFIPLAEESGLIVPIGEWVLRTACKQNKVWQNEGFPPVRVSVNLSAKQFQQQNLVNVVKGILDEAGLDSKYLELEITESAIMQDAERAIAILQDFKDMGIQISIDDFGTGYSSLSYLKQFPVKKLKIDQSFIRTLETNPSDAAIITAIVAMARSLNLEAVAEGVETEEQLEFLRFLECDEMQGFLFSKPLSTGEFAKLLTLNRRLSA